MITEPLTWIIPNGDDQTFHLKRDSKESLGSGAHVQKVYPGTLSIVGSDKYTYVAILKIKAASFSLTPYYLLQSIPKSKYLGGHLLYCLTKEKKPDSLYLVQRLLGPNLFTQCGDLTKFLTGMTNVAKGLAHLHQHGIVHRDVKPENATETKLFDWDAACPAGIHPIRGAPYDFYPPELLIPLHKINPTHHLIQAQHEKLHTWDHATMLSLESTLAPPSGVEGKPALLFTPAFDIFVFGMQFVRFYGHPSTWDQAHPLFLYKALISNTLDFNAEKRKSMEIIAKELSSLI